MDLAGTIRDSGGHGPEQVGSVLINVGPAATLAERLELVHRLVRVDWFLLLQ